MKKTNSIALVILMSLCTILNSACTKEEIIENSSVEKPTHHIGLYAFSKDLLEIYDAKVEAICNGEVVNTIDLKKTEAYSEADKTISYNVDLYTAAPVEYKLNLTCCKEEVELESSRNYNLGFDAQFITVSRAPEKALKMLDEAADCLPQSINGISLQSFYGASSEFNGKTVYAVYAIVNSKSYLMMN